jgi:hypothetical protein
MTVGVKGDGSSATLREFFGPNETISFREIRFSDGLHVSTDEVRQMKSTTLNLAKPPTAYLRDPASQCLRNLLGEVVNTSETILGTSDVNGVPVIRALNGKTESHYAPSVGCATLKQVFRDGGRSLGEKTLTHLTRGEPATALFALPSTLEEVLPSVLHRIRDPLLAAKSDALYNSRRPATNQ